jgi:multiple sugar transport system permease protein
MSATTDTAEAAGMTDRAATADRARRTRRFKKNAPTVVLFIIALIWLIPLWWMFSLSLTPNHILQRDSKILLPPEVTLDNFISVFQVGLSGRWLFNSLVVATATTLLTLLFSAMAGYAFARLQFPGKKILFPVVIAGLMVPQETMFIPLFLIFDALGLHNTHPGLFLPRVGVPLGVFIMTTFFAAIPGEVEEAAQIDGASKWRIFREIMLPMAGPALTALGIFTFVLTWNDYLWPLVSATEREMFTVTTGLASLQGNFAQATELGALMARGVLASLPLLIMFIVFQRQLIRGISLGSGGK